VVLTRQGPEASLNANPYSAASLAIRHPAARSQGFIVS